jgi:hypothetical protein
MSSWVGVERAGDESPDRRPGSGDGFERKGISNIPPTPQKIIVQLTNLLAVILARCPRGELRGMEAERLIFGSRANSTTDKSYSFIKAIAWRNLD